MWLSTTTITPRVAGQGREVAVVDRCVGVLLRVEHPHQQVGELRRAGRPRGGGRPRWSRGRAGRAAPRLRASRGRGSPGSSIESRVVWWRGGMPEPLQQLLGALGAPHASGGPRRGRAPHADRGQLQAGQRVERRRLARAGRPGDARPRCGRPRAAAGRRRARRPPAPRPPRRRRAGPRAARGRREGLDPAAEVACPRVTSRGRPRARTSSSPSASAAARDGRRSDRAEARPGVRRRAHVFHPARAHAQRSGVSGSSPGRRAGRCIAPARLAAAPAPGPRARCGPARRALRTAWSPKTASSSFWPSTAEPPAMPASAPVTPEVWAKTTIISATDSPLTPKARNRAVLRLSAPSVRTMFSTSCCHSRTARSASRRRSREARPSSRPGVAEQPLARGQLAPRRPRPARPRPRRARGSASPGRTRRPR